MASAVSRSRGPRLAGRRHARRQPRGGRAVPRAGPSRGLRGQASAVLVVQYCAAALAHNPAAVDTGALKTRIGGATARQTCFWVSDTGKPVRRAPASCTRETAPSEGRGGCASEPGRVVAKFPLDRTSAGAARWRWSLETPPRRITAPVIGGFFAPMSRGRLRGPGLRPKASRPDLGRVSNPRGTSRLETPVAPATLTQGATECPKTWTR